MTARTAPAAARWPSRSRRSALETAPRTFDEFRAQSAALMSEAELQNSVVALAEAMGWLPYHTFDSRRSDAGFPDLTLAHAVQCRLIFAELKSQRGRLRPAQVIWGTALHAIPGIEYFLWRPSDLLSGAIETALKGRPA